MIEFKQIKLFFILGFLFFIHSTCANSESANAIDSPVNTTSPAVLEAIKTKPPYPKNDPLEWYSSTVLVDQQVAPGVYFAFDINAEARNRVGKHNMPSSLYVIGQKGVLVVETQTTKRLAKELIQLIREKTKLPILYIVNSTPQGDHHFGNEFFPKETKIIQHEETFKLITNPITFEENKKIIGQMAYWKDIKDIKPRAADLLIANNESLRINLGNRFVDVIHFGSLQSKGDLFVYLPDVDAMFTGNIIYSAYPTFGAPWILMGNVDEFLENYRKFKNFIGKNTLILPGHGVPTTTVMVTLTEEYLEDFRKEVKNAYNKGLSVEEAKNIILPKLRPKYGNFSGFEKVQNINIEAFYSNAKK